MESYRHTPKNLYGIVKRVKINKPLTFPVTSVCMLHDGNDCLDKDCKDWVAEEWAKEVVSFFI